MAIHIYVLIHFLAASVVSQHLSPFVQHFSIHFRIVELFSVHRYVILQVLVILKRIKI